MLSEEELTGWAIGAGERRGEVDTVLVVVGVLEGDLERLAGGDFRRRNDAVQC